MFFAQSRELAGKAREELEIDQRESVSSLVNKLRSRFPGLADVNFRVAVNAEFVNDDSRLADGDEVAIIPPVSGG